MGKLEDFLMNTNAAAIAETELVVSERFKDENGKAIPFRIRSITEAENKRIRKECQKVSFDKKTRRKETTTDQDAYLSKLVIACTVEPNFKSAELQAHYGVMGAEALVDALLLPGEYAELLLGVQAINGFDLDEDINATVDEAKN